MAEYQFATPPNTTGVTDPGPIAQAYPVVNQGENDNNLNRQSTLEDHLSFGIGGIAAAAVDTVGRSVGLLGANDTANFLKSFNPGLGDYYTRNKEGLKLGADLATALIPGTMGAKAMQSGSWLFKAVQAERVPFLQRLFTSAADVGELTAGIYQRDLAQAGKMTIDFISRDPERMQLVSQAYKSGLTDAVKRYVGSEAAIYATMNDSETLYPSDMGVVGNVLMHGAGLSIAGGIEAAFIRSNIRRSLQREEIKGFAAKALNPGELPLTTDVKGSRDFPAFLNAVNANNMRSIAEQSTDTTVVSNATRYETLFRNELKTDVEKIYGDGVPGLVSPNAKNPSGVQTILEATRKDPTVLKGIAALESMPSSLEDLTTRIGAADTLAAKAKERAIRLAEKSPLGEASDDINKAWNEHNLYSSLTPVVINAKGELEQVENVKILYQNQIDAPPIRRLAKSTVEDGRAYVEGTDPTTKTKTKLGLYDNLVPIYPGDRKWTDLSRYEQSVMYALGQNFIEKFSTGRDITNKIIVNDKSEPFVLDVARSILGKNPKALSEFTLPAEAQANPVKWLEQTSLVNKFDQYTTMFKRFNSQMNAAFIGPPYPGSMSDRITSYTRYLDPTMPSLDDIRYALNFPASYLGNEHPAFNVFRSLAFQGDTKLKTALGSLDDFQLMMKEEALKIGGVPAGLAGDKAPEVIDFMRAKPLATTGDNLAFPKDKNGDFMRSQIAWIKPAPWDMTKDAVDTFATGRKMEFINKFTSAPALINDIFNSVTNSSATPFVRKVDTLVDGQQAGRGFVNYQNAATRDLDVFAAADMVSTVAENKSRTYMRDLFKAYNDSFTKLNGDQASMFEFSQFVQARRYGFELLPDTEAGTNGTRFRLATVADATGEAHTSRNETAFQKAFRDALPVDPTGQPFPYLPDIAGSLRAGKLIPLEIGDTALASASAMRDMSKALYEHASFFRDLYGRNKISYQEWHVPPQNLSRDFVKYIVYPAEAGDQPVKTIVTGKSAAELEKKMATPAIRELTEQPGARIIDQNDLRNYFDLHDEAFFNLVDFSDTLAQTGGRNTGTAVAPLLEYGPQVLNDLIKGVENQITATSRRTLSALFQDEINYARIADAGSQVNSSLPRGVKTNSIWNMYVNRVLGVTEPQSKNVINAEVPYFDQMLSGLRDRVRGFLPARNAADNVSRNTEKDFAALKETLGGKLPYTDAADFAESTFKVKAPKDLAHFSGLANSVTANLVLRIAETGNALISIFGNLVSLPLVANGLRRTSVDTDASWAARSGFMGVDLGGRDFNLPNPVRMLSKSVGFLFTDEGQQMIKEAREFGNIKPQMAEAYRIMHRPFEGPYKTAFNKLIDTLSIPSDKGEELARMWAYSAGYNIARGNGLTNKYDLHNIANLFADNSIANYRPSNKPRIFQGALGAPLGLFQTYMFNYYNRLFSYIENKNYRALTINYALQGGVFGLESVPGWQQFNSLYSHAYDGQTDVVDSLDRKYGRNMADVLLHGSISNIPRLFGKDGIALYSRGDVNLSRVPAFISPENAPIFNLATNVAELSGALIDQFRTGGVPSAQRTAEILGTYSINRPFSRMMELAAGVSADKRGGLITNDTLTGMSIASRVMGLRPTIEATNMETMHRIATTEGYQEAIHQRATASVRSLFRGNVSEEKLNDGISKVVTDYLSSGGTPDGVASFIRDAAISSKLTKTESKFLGIMNNPGRLNDTLRLVDSMQGYGQ